MALLDFPNPVNEKAARVVAGLVLASAVAILVAAALGALPVWAIWLLAAGFALRVASGPRFSPFGLLATKVLAPRLGPARLVAGPPKRFAQAIGLVVTTAAAIAATLGAPTVALALLAVLVVAAGLESIVGLCLGCWIFSLLIRAGVVPESVCEACANVEARLREASARQRASA